MKILNKNKSNKISAIIVILIIAAALFIKNNADKNKLEETVVFPVVDEEFLNEMKNGGHTGYFDSYNVLNEYLTKEYPNQKFEIEEEDEKRPGYKKYEVEFKDKNLEKEILLKQNTFKLSDEEFKIWCVAK